MEGIFWAGDSWLMVRCIRDHVLFLGHMVHTGVSLVILLLEFSLQLCRNK